MNYYRAAAIIALLSAVGACGIRGPLETPPPLWGNEARTPPPPPGPFEPDEQPSPEVILPESEDVGNDDLVGDNQADEDS